MNANLLEDNWEILKIKVIKPLWFQQFRDMYENSKMGYDDFESLAGFEFTKAFKNYQDEKSNLFTYATTVLMNKAKSELRNYNERDKRKALSTAISIDSVLYDDNNGEITLGDTLVAKEQEDISALTERYLDSLTVRQRRVAELMMDGYEEKDIKRILGLSNEKYKMIITNMCEERKLAPLKKLKERARKNGKSC